jgi:hypothetical protein
LRQLDYSGHKNTFQLSSWELNTVGSQRSTQGFFGAFFARFLNGSGQVRVLHVPLLPCNHLSQAQHVRSISSTINVTCILGSVEMLHCPNHHARNQGCEHESNPTTRCVLAGH